MSDAEKMLGNEENLQKVRRLMEKADKISLGSDLETTVPIDYTSFQGKKYEGEVTFKRPNVQDFMKMGALKSEILRKSGVKDINLVDIPVKALAQTMATLKYVIVSSPKWLQDVEKMHEPDVLYHIHDKYEEWENSFRTNNDEKHEGDSEASQSTEAVDAP